jgi:hypothetical protein
MEGRNPKASVQISTPGWAPVSGWMKAALQVPSGVSISTLFSITSRPVPVMAALSPEKSLARFDGGLRLK